VGKVHQNAVKIENLIISPKLPQIPVLCPAPHSYSFQITLFLCFELRTMGCRGVLVGKVHQNAVKIENLKISPKLPKSQFYAPHPTVLASKLHYFCDSSSELWGARVFWWEKCIKMQLNSKN